MKIREFLNLTLARVGLKRLNSVELKKLDSVEKLEEVISMKKEDYAPKLLIDYSNEKEGSIIKKLNIDSFMKSGETIEKNLSWLVSLLRVHIEQLGKSGLGLNLDKLIFRCNNIEDSIHRHNQDLNRILLGWEEEMTIKENKIIELEDEVRRLKEEVDFHKKLSAANSMSSLEANKALSSLSIESKSDSNKDILALIESKTDSKEDILALKEEVKSLKELITPSIPAIQTTQKMMHSDKSGDNNPNSKINEDEFKRLIKEEHKPAKELAEHFDVSVQAIYKRAESLGIKELLKKRKPLPSEKLEVRKIKFD